MPSRVADYEGQTAGTTISVANSDDFGDAVISSLALGTSGNIAFSAGPSNVSAYGTRCLAFSGATTATSFNYNLGATGSSFAVRFYIYLTANPSAAIQFPVILRNASNSLAARLQMTTGRQLQMINTAGTQVGTSMTALALNTWYRVEWYGTGLNTTSGSFTLKSFVGHSTTEFDTRTATGVTTTQLFQQLFVGRGSSASANTWYMDAIAAQNDNATPWGPALPPDNAGADQTNIEPGTTVTLTGNNTGAAWSQTGGSPSVILGGSGNVRTFTAPYTAADTTLTFTYGTDTMTVGVRKARQQMVSTAGIWIPTEHFYISEAPLPSIIEYRGGANSGNSANASSRSCTLPASLLANDIVVVHLGQWNGGGTPTITPHAGFEKALDYTSGDTNGKNSVWWKRLTGPDSGTITFNFNAAFWSTMQLLVFRGCVTSGNPIGTKYAINAGTFGAIPTLTVTDAAIKIGDCAVHTVYNNTNGAHTPATNFTETADVDSASSSYQVLPGSGSAEAAGASIASSSAAGSALYVLSAA